MAKPKRLKLCALNIVIHDENHRDYRQLIKDATQQQAIKAFNKTHAATLVWTGDQRYDGQKYLIGRIYKFINVKPPYFDTDINEIIKDNEGQPIDFVPKKIKSNAKEIHFCLLEDIHRIFVDTENFSPQMAKKFFDDILNRDIINKKYGSVDVMLHTEERAIEAMLAMYSLRRITIRVSRPNPVGMNRFDKEVLDELTEQGAEKMDLALSTRGSDLKPNDNTKKYMYAATDHGYVKATGRDEEGGTVNLSTEKYPVIHSGIIAKEEPQLNSLVRITKEMWAKMMHNNGKNM